MSKWTSLRDGFTHYVAPIGAGIGAGVLTGNPAIGFAGPDKRSAYQSPKHARNYTRKKCTAKRHPQRLKHFGSCE